MDQESEYSKSGEPRYRHGKANAFREPANPKKHLAAIREHVEKYIGKVDNVLSELVSDQVCVDVLYSAPTESRPFHTLVTSGMSEKAMFVPEQFQERRFAELMICLPKDWPMDDEKKVKEPSYWWPIRGLFFLARYPHAYNTWLTFGHTVPNGDPPKPFSSQTELCCWALFRPLTVPKDFSVLAFPYGKYIHFFSVFPLYRDEMDAKLEHGVEVLFPGIDKYNQTEVLDPKRPHLI